jgi:hypothetical protein
MTPEALARLGADVLAGVLVEHAGVDPILRKKLRLLLAAEKGAGNRAAELEKRIRTIGRSRSIVDWEKRKGLEQEFDPERRRRNDGAAPVSSRRLR